MPADLRYPDPFQLFLQLILLTMSASSSRILNTARTCTSRGAKQKTICLSSTAVRRPLPFETASPAVRAAPRSQQRGFFSLPDLSKLASLASGSSGNGVEVHGEEQRFHARKILPSVIPICCKVEILTHLQIFPSTALFSRSRCLLLLHFHPVLQLVKGPCSLRLI